MNGYIIISIAVGSLMAGILFGYHYKTLIYTSEEVEMYQEQSKRLAKGQANIISFNQDIKNELQKSKDPCFNAKLPSHMRKLLK